MLACYTVLRESPSPPRWVIAAAHSHLRHGPSVLGYQPGQYCQPEMMGEEIVECCLYALQCFVLCWPGY